MRRRHVVHYTQAILLLDIRCLDPCLLEYFPANRPKGIWLPSHSRGIPIALKKPADHMVAPDIHIYSLSLVKQNISITRLSHAATLNCIAYFSTFSYPLHL